MKNSKRFYDILEKIEDWIVTLALLVIMLTLLLHAYTAHSDTPNAWNVHVTCKAPSDVARNQYTPQGAWRSSLTVTRF